MTLESVVRMKEHIRFIWMTFVIYYYRYVLSCVGFCCADQVRFSMVIYFLFLVSFSVSICSQLDRVIFCVFLKSDKELYETMLPAYFPRGLSSHTFLLEFSCFIETYIVSFILNTLYTLSPKINPH